MFIYFFICAIKCLIEDFPWETLSEICIGIIGIFATIIGIILVIPVEIILLPLYLIAFVTDYILNKKEKNNY